MTFQEKLMALRKQHGWSQEYLGIQIGVSRQTVSKWELGSTTPELDKLIQLSDLFELSLDELVGRENIASASSPQSVLDLQKKQCPKSSFEISLISRLFRHCFSSFTLSPFSVSAGTGSAAGKQQILPQPHFH